MSKHLGDSETVDAIVDWRGPRGVVAPALIEAGFIRKTGDVHVLDPSCPFKRILTRRIEYGATWRTIKAAIIKRDGGACRTCSSRDRIEVHHIRPLLEFEGDTDAANDSGNLITLCRTCHRHEDNRLRKERAVT